MEKKKKTYLKSFGRDRPSWRVCAFLCKLREKEKNVHYRIFYVVCAATTVGGGQKHIAISLCAWLSLLNLKASFQAFCISFAMKRKIMWLVLKYILVYQWHLQTESSNSTKIFTSGLFMAVIHVSLYIHLISLKWKLHANTWSKHILAVLLSSALLTVYLCEYGFSQQCPPEEILSKTVQMQWSFKRPTPIILFEFSLHIKLHSVEVSAQLSVWF